jgi:hypothetical protein
MVDALFIQISRVELDRQYGYLIEKSPDCGFVGSQATTRPKKKNLKAEFCALLLWQLPENMTVFKVKVPIVVI